MPPLIRRPEPARRPGRALLILVALLLPAPASAQAGTIILARHAEKAAPGGDPELTPEGLRRAEALAQVVADVRLAAIFTTQFRRTRLTAAPAARAAGIAPTVLTATGNLTEDAAAVARVIDALPAGAAVLVVGHSNTVGLIITALGGPALPDLCDGEHATLFTLVRPADGPPHLLRSRYGAAEPPDATACHGGR
ncbi:MAG: histidine phosphatase family protein [Gemmatimonadetes bacterium]|nr:histidine phosphatase family protein [Gemmatimonadota bacterium]